MTLCHFTGNIITIAEMLSIRTKGGIAYYI